MRICLIGVVAVAAGLLVAGCGGDDEPATVATTTTVTETASTTTEATTTAAQPDCTGEFRDDLREGRCLDGNQKNRVVNRDSTLKMPELDVRILSVDTTDVLADVGVEKANGVFLIFELEVKNRLSEPVPFDPNQDQTVYFSGGNNYTQDFDAENGGDTDSFNWQGEDIQPGNSQVGTVVFDVPKKAAKGVDTDGNLIVIDFSEAESGGRLKGPLGTIRTYAP